ncbi:MAG: magnesium/cobalt efflux protein [Bacteroidetes bacterium MED-G20]|nr:MAG: magnesium/cobalt efflux protein [Bacteroidetes bacterium MED-G20]
MLQNNLIDNLVIVDNSVFNFWLFLFLLLFLILISAFLSGSEVAIFGLSNTQKETLIIDEKNKNSQRIINLISDPKKLLATILIGNNLVNVAIVLVSSLMMNHIFEKYSLSPLLNFIIQVVLVTFFILLFGEVIPKVYANNYNLKFSKLMAFPISILKVLFNPLSNLLISSTSIIDKKIDKKIELLNADELEYALDLTKDSVDNKEEKKILEGIVKFGNTDVKQIMTPRTDVVAFQNDLDYKSLINDLKAVKFSRIPVYKDSFDKIKGILYVKDLIGKIKEPANYQWTKLLRDAKFVPENKKLDDLLKEFQEEKTHIAIVVDEYGGSSGIVSLEDVLEEIVGDITDEFDEKDVTFLKIDEKNYLFDGKTPLIDFYKILNIDGQKFEVSKGESDTLAGFCIENAGKILLKNEKIVFENYTFTVEASDKRRIKKIKIKID